MNSVIGLDGMYSSGLAPSRTPACGDARLPVAEGLAEEEAADAAASTAAETMVEAMLVRWSQASLQLCLSWLRSASGYFRPGLVPANDDAFARQEMPERRGAEHKAGEEDGARGKGSRVGNIAISYLIHMTSSPRQSKR